MKTMVIDVKGRGSIFVEGNIDKVAEKYGMEKVRTAERGMYLSLFPDHIQWTLKCSTLKALWIAVQVNVATKYCICRDSIKFGWAVEN